MAGSVAGVLVAVSDAVTVRFVEGAMDVSRVAGIVGRPSTEQDAGGIVGERIEGLRRCAWSSRRRRICCRPVPLRDSSLGCGAALASDTVG